MNRQSWTVAVAGAAILMCPVLWNGAPIFYDDSAAYLNGVAKALGAALPPAGGAPPITPSDGAPGAGAGPLADRTVFSGRSIYYSALAWIGTITSVWVVVAAQCLVAAWTVGLAVRRVAGAARPGATLLLLGALALLTPASFFAGLITPDIWAGLAIVALAILWTPGGVPLSRAETAGLAAVLGLAALFHGSHVALLSVMLALGAAAGVRRRTGRRALAVPAAALCAGVAGGLAFSAAVTAVYGKPPVARPFVTAHLVDLGPGTRLAQGSCPGSGYAICDYAGRLPMPWTAFLFARGEEGVFMSAPDLAKRALADEQLAFAVATLRAYPVDTVFGLAADGLRQLWTLDVASIPRGPHSTPMAEMGFAPRFVAMTGASRLWHDPALTGAVTRMAEVGAAASAAVLLAWGAMRGAGRAAPAPRYEAFALACLAGLAANALICGVLASPYGRFQARVVWILPFLVLLLAIVRAHDRAPADGTHRRIVR